MHCAMCSRLHSDGQYCLVCGRVWHYGQPFEGAQCDGCDFWIHGACDQASAVVARGGSAATTYFCPQCRQRKAAEAKQKREQQQAAAAAAAAGPAHAAKGKGGARGQGARTRESGMPAALVAYINATSGFLPLPAPPSAAPSGADTAKTAPGGRSSGATPKRVQRPKSAWQLFGRDFFAKYRANYPNGPPDFAEVYRLQGEAWRNLSASERERYDNMAATEAALLKQRIHDAAVVLAAASGAPAAESHVLVVPHEGQAAPASAVAASEAVRSVAVRPAAPRMRGLLPVLPSPAVVLSRGGVAAMSGAPGANGVPPRVRVTCNGVEGDLITAEFRIACACNDCERKQASRTAASDGTTGEQAPGPRTFTCSEWERHVGMAHAKKWKGSIRLIQPGFERMPIGRWLDGGTASVRRQRGEQGAPGDDGAAMAHSVANYVPPPASGSLGYEPVIINWSVDRCAVCDDDRDFEWDQLVSCEGCHVTVHQSCYGVTALPDAATGWLCTACEETGGSASEQKRCAMCPVEGGAMKPTSVPGLWAHLACCQWIPETCVLDVKAMQPIDRLRHIQRERWELLCTICKQRHGAKVQCEHDGCYLAFHPLCARASGFFMEVQEEEAALMAPRAAAPEGAEVAEDDGPPVRMVSYCHKHYPPDPHRQAMYGGRNMCAPGSAVARQHAEQPHAALPIELAPHTLAASHAASVIPSYGHAVGDVSVAGVEHKDAGMAREMPTQAVTAEPQKEPAAGAAPVEEDMHMAPSSVDAEAGLVQPPLRMTCARERTYVPQGHPRTEAAPPSVIASAPPLEGDQGVEAAAGDGMNDPVAEQSDPAPQLDGDAAAVERENAPAAAMPPGQSHMRRAIRDDTAAADAIEQGLLPPVDGADVAMGDAAADLKRRRSSEGGFLVSADALASKKPRRAAAPLDEDADAPPPVAMPLSDDDIAAPLGGMEVDETGAQDMELGEEQAPVAEEEPPRPPPGPVRVTCRNLEGTYLPDASKIACHCARCEAVQASEGSAVMWTPPQWESHAGMGQAKKWKSSIRVILEDDGDGNESNDGSDGVGDGDGDGDEESGQRKKWMFIGRWFEMVGLAPKSNRLEHNGRLPEAAQTAGQQLARLHNGRFTSPATIAAAAASGQLMGCGRSHRATLQPAAIDSDVTRKAVTAAHVAAATAAAASASAMTTSRIAAALAAATPPTVDELITTAALALMGAKLRVKWSSDGQWHTATIVAVCCVRSLARHRLLYEEPAGAEEWLLLAAEQVEYIEPSDPPGLPAGMAQPTIPPAEFNQAGTVIDPLTWRPEGVPAPEPVSTGPMPAQEQARLAREQADEAAINAAQAQEAAAMAAAAAEAATAEVAAVYARSARLGCGREGWLCCDSCGKWRRAPAEVADDVARSGGGAQWFCAYNASADPAYASCDAAQELSDEAIDELIAQGNEAQEAAQQAAQRAAEAAESAAEADADAHTAAAAAEAASGGGAALEELAATLPGGPAAAVLAAYGAAITVAFNLPMQPFPLRASNSMLAGPLPGIFTVVARTTPGELRLKDQLVRCVCRACAPSEYRHAAPGDTDPPVNNTGSAVRGCFFDPNKWENHVGMGQAKKWKSSVRIVLEDGSTASVGGWLESLGLSKAKIKPPKPDTAVPLSAAAVLRQTRLAELEAARKQQQRAGAGGGLNQRKGKRLYVEAMPYVIRQVGPHRAADQASVGLIGAGGPSYSTPQEAHVFTPEAWAVACGLDDGTTDAAAVPAPVVPAPDAAVPLAEGDAAAGGPGAAATGPSVAAVPLRERLAECRRSERARLMFGKSSIHGWGLFARAAHPVGAMVVEYRGERVRTTVADIREARYARSGQDCYLLRLDDQHTIDSTLAGNMARFTNHSCNPNMYAKVLSVDGHSHVRHCRVPCVACD